MRINEFLKDVSILVFALLFGKSSNMSSWIKVSIDVLHCVSQGLQFQKADTFSAKVSPVISDLKILLKLEHQLLKKPFKQSTLRPNRAIGSIQWTNTFGPKILKYIINQRVLGSI